MDETIIVGVGNPFRSDDGVGWAVIDALHGKVPPEVHLSKQRGDIAELLSVFARFPIVYLIDACQKSTPVGSWQRIDALRQPLFDDNEQTSTHGFGISQAIALAENLQQLPAQLIIYAISANMYQMNKGLSEPVAQSIPLLTKAIIQDIQSCTKKA
jgi:hydrogenase maturation protease